MLLEGPFESDYSLAIVNRRLALALLRLGQPIQLHQRDNTTDYPPSAGFIAAWPELAPCFVSSVDKFPGKDSLEMYLSRRIPIIWSEPSGHSIATDGKNPPFRRNTSRLSTGIWM